MAGVRILTDPFLRPGLGPLERHGPLPDPGRPRSIDIVVISHGHPDHFDPASLAAIPGHPLVIVPRGLGRTVRQGDGWRCRRGRRGRSARRRRRCRSRRCRLAIGSRPAPPRAQPRRLPHRGVGRRVWFAGDTGRFDEMRAARRAGRRRPAARLDVGTAPRPGHLGPRSAAEVLREVGPAAAVPIHWGTLYPRRLHRRMAGPAGRARRALRGPRRTPGARCGRARAAARRGDVDRAAGRAARSVLDFPRPMCSEAS